MTNLRLIGSGGYGVGGAGRSSLPTAHRSGKFFGRIDDVVFRGWDPLLRGGRRNVDRALARYSSWGLPETVAVPSTTGSGWVTPADRQKLQDSAQADEAAPPTKVSMRDLVENRLSTRRQLFESQAINAFKAGRYQEACDQLMLAEAAAMSEPDQRVYLRLLHVYACIASQKYAQAINSVRWILQRKPEDGGSACPEMLNRFRNVQILYGHTGDYTLHSQALDRYLAEHRNHPEVTVLEAMWAWGRGDALNAKWHARRFIDALDKLLAQQAEASNDVKPTTEWHRFIALFEEAEKVGAVGQAQPVLETAPASEGP